MMNKKELEQFNKDRWISQVCYVTYDYKKTIEYLTENLMMGPWLILANTQTSTYKVEKDGKPVTESWKFLIAVTMMGNTQVEVIQPVEGPNPYWKFLFEKGPGLHHFKESIPNDGKLMEHIEKLKACGNKVIYTGHYENDIYAYLDTYKELGAYYELGNAADVKFHPELIGYYPED